MTRFTTSLTALAFFTQVAQAQTAPFEITPDILQAAPGETDAERGRNVLVKSCLREEQAAAAFRRRDRAVLSRLFTQADQCYRAFYIPNQNNPYGALALDLSNKAYLDAQSARLGWLDKFYWQPR